MWCEGGGEGEHRECGKVLEGESAAAVEHWTRVNVFCRSDCCAM